MKAPETLISGGVGAELEDPRRQELIDRLDRARRARLAKNPSVQTALREFGPPCGSVPLTGQKIVCNDIIKPWLTAAAGADSVLSMSADEEAL
ncbi:hypothetical protein Aspvir_006246 [Aspergillus viridinutans]|uniref:Uncharacterized protein n=1 Tax=Aspergillus viridinutans TaxID=75553 RepID=A0A9P3F5N6_ASPVI|nr:uncharacterized protein Aspvir_006246 [Aspergillus viridinutans]GIK02201.1 hypothetical protein Aspvir_006246 [Aspergillus viridinutans]